MKPQLSLVCLAAAATALAACGSKEDSGSGSTSAAPPVTTVAAQPTTATTSLVLAVEEPGRKAGIDARVKAEVDGRTDGLTGSPLAATGARASLQSPTGWTSTKGDVTVVASSDKKAQLAATGFGTEGAEAKLAAAATAMGLTACEWNGQEHLTIGKNNLSGGGADGKCMRGATPVQTAYVASLGEGLLVVGAWEAGGDSASIFGSMRSITKAAGSGGAGGLGPCCAALHQNGKNAPPDQQAMYAQAAAICDGLKNSPQAAVAIASIRAALRSAKMPADCK